MLLRKRVDGNVVEGRYRPCLGFLGQDLLQLNVQRSIFPGFQPWMQTERILKSTADIHYRDIRPDEVDVGNLQGIVAFFIDGAEDPGMLIDERFTTIKLLPDDVGEAAVFRVMRGKALRITAVPGVTFALDDRRNLGRVWQTVIRWVTSEALLALA